MEATTKGAFELVVRAETEASRNDASEATHELGFWEAFRGAATVARDVIRVASRRRRWGTTTTRAADADADAVRARAVAPRAVAPRAVVGDDAGRQRCRAMAMAVRADEARARAATVAGMPTAAMRAG